MKNGVGGWLLVLCLLLVVWQPISFGLLASSLLDRLATRGLPLALALITRILVTAFGIAAGLALFNLRPGAVTMAKLSLALTAATDLVIYTTPLFPSNRPPGDTPLYIAGSFAYATAWMLYLVHSKRVHNTFS